MIDQRDRGVGVTWKFKRKSMENQTKMQFSYNSMHQESGKHHGSMAGSDEEGYWKQYKLQSHTKTTPYSSFCLTRKGDEFMPIGWGGGRISTFLNFAYIDFPYQRFKFYHYLTNPYQFKTYCWGIYFSKDQHLHCLLQLIALKTLLHIYHACHKNECIC